MRSPCCIAALACLLALSGCNARKPDCQGTATNCGGSCVELRSDNLNCGACGGACEPGEVCSRGSCAVSCAAELVNCGGSCVDPLTSTVHCGAAGTCAGSEAGVACAAGQQCSGGACACPTARPDACGAGAAAFCAALDADPWNCGACGNACVAGQVCAGGTCEQTCSSAQPTACPVADPTYCANTSVDANNCGACGIACPAGQQCSAGACSCPGARPDACGASVTAFCTDLDTDPLNCGTCGVVCVTGTACAGGACARVQPDVTPPTATLTSPADDATGVPLDAALWITFSEPVDVGWVSVVTTPSLALGARTWAPGNTAVTFAPAGLVAETTYAVQVSAADLAGNLLAPAVFHFTTVHAPPRVLATSPHDAATDAPVTTAIQLVFSEPMDPASVAAAFSSSPAVTCRGGVTWSSATIATCTPAASLDPDQVYTVTLAATARDLAGDAMPAPTSFSFTTGTEPHTLGPSVASTVPGDGATGVGPRPGISVTFDEPVDKATAEAAFGIVSPSGFGGGTFSWSANGRTMTYVPPASFEYGTVVSWRLGTGVVCLGGLSLAAEVYRSFRVVRQATATFHSVAALDGYVSNTATSADTTGTILYVGDTSENDYDRAFLSFDLAAIPTTAGIVAATLYVNGIPAVAGDPFRWYGDLVAQSVDYGESLTPADLDTPVLQYVETRCFMICGRDTCRPSCTQGAWDDEYTVATAATEGLLSLDVTGTVARDRAARAARGDRSQFRLRFQTDTDDDGQADSWGITSGDSTTGKPVLHVVYVYP